MRSLLLALALLATLAGAAGAQERWPSADPVVAVPTDAELRAKHLASPHFAKAQALGLDDFTSLSHVVRIVQKPRAGDPDPKRLLIYYAGSSWTADQRLDGFTIFRFRNERWRVAMEGEGFKKRQRLPKGYYRVVDIRTLHQIDGYTAEIPIIEPLD